MSDFTVDLGDGEKVELAVEAGLDILLRVWSGGEEVDVAVTPEKADELIMALSRAVLTARSGNTSDYVKNTRMMQ